MSDNVTANAGSGGAVFASDDISGVQFPRTKVAWGVDGSAVDASATNPFPVVDAAAASAIAASTLPTGSGTAAAAGRVTLASDDPAVVSLASLVALPTAAYSAAVSLTRTNDTSAYAANDVMGAATGSTAALTFTSMGPSARRVLITSASLEIDATGVISGETSYRLHLYGVTPPSALGDNVAFDIPSGDRASYLGFVDLGIPVDMGSTLYVEANSINKVVKLAGTSLFGYLVTVGAYTPTASRVHVVTLHALAL